MAPVSVVLTRSLQVSWEHPGGGGRRALQIGYPYLARSCNVKIHDNEVCAPVTRPANGRGTAEPTPSLAHARTTWRRRSAQVDMYKFVFPPTHKHPTLCMIGLVQPIGGIMPLSELQARWAVRVFRGKVRCRP